MRQGGNIFREDAEDEFRTKSPAITVQLRGVLEIIKKEGIFDLRTEGAPDVLP
jgi:hypothetical protein